MFKRNKPSEHPTITSGRYHTQDGNIYIQRDDGIWGSDSNLLIVFYVQIMPDDLVMQLHRF